MRSWLWFVAICWITIDSYINSFSKLPSIDCSIPFFKLAQTVVDAGAIAHLAQMILNPDAKLKVSHFSHILHHSRWSYITRKMINRQYFEQKITEPCLWSLVNFEQMNTPLFCWCIIKSLFFLLQALSLIPDFNWNNSAPNAAAFWLAFLS